MTLTKEAGLLGLDDVKIFEVIADTAQTLTYGSAIDVPSMQDINLAPNYIQKPLMQDEEIDGYYSKLQSVSWSFSNVKVSLDALAILEGGELDSTDPQKYILTLSDTSAPKYFKLEGKINYSPDTIGDFHLVLYKCMALSVYVEYKAQNYAIVSANGIAIPTINSSVLGSRKVRDYVINETATPIS